MPRSPAADQRPWKPPVAGHTLAGQVLDSEPTLASSDWAEASVTRVTIEEYDLQFIREEGRVVVAIGTAENGDRIWFAGDREPMRKFIGAVELFGAATAEVPDRMILRRIAPADDSRG